MANQKTLEPKDFSEVRKKAELENLTDLLYKSETNGENEKSEKIKEAIGKLNDGSLSLEELEKIKGIKSKKQSNTGGVEMAGKKNAGTGRKGAGLVDKVREKLKAAGKDLTKDDFEKIASSTGAKVSTVRTQYYQMRK